MSMAVGIGIALASGMAYVWSWRNTWRQRVALRQALTNLGVEVEWEQVLGGVSHRQRGKVGGTGRVTFTLAQLRGGYRMRMSGLTVVRPLGLSRQDGLRNFRASAGGDNQTGDPAFDKVVRVSGPLPLALARLDVETRQRAMAVFSGTASLARAVLADGQLEGEIRSAGRIEDFQAALHALIQLALALEPPRPLSRALADNVARDPERGVRLANLRVLGSDFPDEWATRDARVRACSDPDELVALTAALQLREHGRDTLLRLAREGRDDEVASAAISALGAALPADDLLNAWRSARDERRSGKTLACLAALASHPDAAALGGAEPLLVEDLGSARAGVPEAAARVLGRLGSVDAVLPLKDAEEHGGALGAAARQAVAEIQSRASGAAPGQVSLASGEAGQVSIADDASGRVSVPEE